MNILVVARSAKYGGIATYTQNLIQFFLITAKKGDKYVIVIPDVSWAQPYKGNRDSRFIFIFKKPTDSLLRQFLWQQFVVPVLAIKHRVDVLFSTANFATLCSPCKQILLIRIPVFFSNHYIHCILPKKKLFEKIDFALRKASIIISAMRADVILFPTRSMRDDFYVRAPWIQKKMIVNYYGVHGGTHRDSPQRSGSMQSITRLLYISHYTDYKNFTTAFKALGIMVQQGFQNIEFVVSIDFESPVSRSSVTYHQDKTLIQSPTLKNHIANIGVIPHERALQLYSTADIFLWPTLTESFGHPLLEAMASGCPIICSDISINREICGDSVLYFSPLDPADLAQTIVQVLYNRDQAENRTQKAKKRSREFSWRDHGNRLLEIMKNICAE